MAYTHSICVEFGDKPRGEYETIIYVKLLGKNKNGEDEDGKEEKLCVTKVSEKRGFQESFKVGVPNLIEINGIEIHGNKIDGKGGWNIDKVMVTNRKTQVVTVFPVFTYIISDKTFKFMTNDLALPQSSSRKEDRRADLRVKRRMYELTDDKFPGCPPIVEDLPPAEDFSFLYEDLVVIKLEKKRAEAKLKKFFGREFQSFDDIEDVFGEFFPKPSNLQRWHDDVQFGKQRLMSVNPDMIRLCTYIPGKLKVTDQELGSCLEKKTLSAAIDEKRIFIIDYKILENIPTKKHFVMTAPIALFYQRNDGKLVPIAIQLYQKPGKNNPVFLPSDPNYTWILAKMWFNVADSNYHQSVTHLGFTHLKMEGIVACTHRQIHLDHPIFKLLMPHFLYLLAINYHGIPQLLGENGYVSKLLNLGEKGMVELIRRKNQTWQMNKDGTLQADLKDRGVDDRHLLPDYYYRNDATKLYDAILRYVTNYLDLYYVSDADVQRDHELQSWRNKMVAPVSEQGLCMLGVFGENGKFTEKKQVCLTLTSIIFTCSVKHAAVNFSQYEDYGYPPNFPLCLHGSPPINKNAIGEEELLQHLPQMSTTLDTLVITDVLSTNRMHALGAFEVQYIHDEKALEVLKKFRNDLKQIASEIEERNSKQKNETYNSLNPKKVPNSISI